MAFLVCVDGRLVEAAEAWVGADDPGLLYGLGLFETMMVIGRAVPFLGRHLERLWRSAPLIELPIPVSKDEMGHMVRETVRLNGVEEGVCRLTVTAGGRVIVAVRHGRPYEDQIYQRGFRAVWASSCRNERSPLSRVKSLNYADSWLERRRAIRAGFDEALFLNSSGYLSEGAVSNVFFWRGGELCTPSPGCGALPGIARGIVMELAQVEGVRVLEGEFPPASLLEADEAFVTNALMGVMPLVSVDSRAIGDGRPGVRTLHLLTLYRHHMLSLVEG